MEELKSAYGVISKQGVDDQAARICEEIEIRGFAVVPDIISTAELATIKEKILTIQKKQEEEFGTEELSAINDLNNVRAPLMYDDFFLQVAMNETVCGIASKMLGNYYILHLQSAIINKPSKQHHQAQWHRDLPYQHFTSSRPLSISALFCIDDFTKETGGTIVLPFSHKVEYMPSQHYSDKYNFQVEAKAGSVIIFDSMLFHKAGENTSPNIRMAINHVYVLPFIKQQITFSGPLRDKYGKDAGISKFLGYDSLVPDSVLEYRNIKKNKKK